MKISRHILSDNGILVTTVLLLMFAAAFSCVGIVMEAQDHMAGIPLLAIDDDTVSYVLAGVMGDIPSTAGTLQSIGLFIAYVVVPVVASIMLAMNASVETDAIDLYGTVAA